MKMKFQRWREARTLSTLQRSHFEWRWEVFLSYKKTRGTGRGVDRVLISIFQEIVTIWDRGFGFTWDHSFWCESVSIVACGMFPRGMTYLLERSGPGSAWVERTSSCVRILIVLQSHGYVRGLGVEYHTYVGDVPYVRRWCTICILDIVYPGI